MEKYIPDIYKKSIYEINYDSLVLRGIKCLFFDLDNTLIKVTESSSTEEVKKLFKELKKKGFDIKIVSNSIKTRVKPVADQLNVDYLSLTNKPKTYKVKDLIDSTKYGLDQIAIIGDSMTDDIVCGNKLVITTILVDQISKKEFPIAKIKRFYEKRIQKKLRDHDLFTKGRYYE